MKTHFWFGLTLIKSESNQIKLSSVCRTLCSINHSFSIMVGKLLARGSVSVEHHHQQLVVLASAAAAVGRS